MAHGVPKNVVGGTHSTFRSAAALGLTVAAPCLQARAARPAGALLSQFYAEEHPSDANYLALAGGSAFGIPLDDPAEENSQYTINARNTGDLAVAAHESWKTYHAGLGLVSPVRYTHYSLLRTIEAALGLGTLTANDRYAQPVNDVFDPAAPGAIAPLSAAPVLVPAPAGLGSVVSRGPARGGSPPTAWVANYGSATVTPVNLASRKAGKAIKVGAARSP